MAKSKRGHGCKWTAKDVALLKKLYPERPFDEIAKRLGRTVASAKTQAYLLGLKRKSYVDKLWTAKEVALLKKLYPECPVGEIAKRLGRTVASVHTRAHLLGIKRKGWCNKVWSAHELALLKKLYPHCKCPRDVAKQLGRPVTAVRQRAYSLGIKMAKSRLWSAGELKLLRELYPVKSLKELAEQLGRSPEAVRFRARAMGLWKESGRKVWSNEDNKLLKKMYPKNTMQAIADKLGRSFCSVEKRARELGLRKRPSYAHYPRWSAKEIELLKKLYPHRNSQEVADKIGRSVGMVRARASKLGLKKSKKFLKTLGRG